MALTTNIIPHITSSFIKKDMTSVNYRINQALCTMLIITIPMSILLILLSKEAYYIFYGTSNYGYMILKFSAVSHVFLGIWSVLSSTLQSMKKFKQIYIYSICGLVLNAILDIPLILLFDKMSVIRTSYSIGLIIDSIKSISSCVKPYFLYNFSSVHSSLKSWIGTQE